MITQRFSVEAETASVRYSVVVDAWRSIYRGSLDAADFGSPRQLAVIRSQAYSIATGYLERERGEIARISAEIAERARESALEELGSIDARALPEAASDHLSVTEQHLANEIAIQIERDIGALQQAVRRTALQVGIAAQSRGVSRRAALLQYRLGNPGELEFYFKDRRNQKFPAQKFIRSVWRHHLLSLYNEVTLLTLADHGEIAAQVRHVNPSSEFDSTIIAMSSGSQHPIYVEVRDAIFHPNADAVLGRVRSDVHS